MPERDNDPLSTARLRTPPRRQAAAGKTVALVLGSGSARGWAHILPLSGRPAGQRTQSGPKPPGMIEAFADAINIMQDSITRSRMAGDPPDVLITPHMASIGMMDFVRAEQSIAIGYSAVERLLPEIEHHLKQPG